MRESSRIGINLIALLFSRFTGMALALVQSGIIFRALTLERTGQFGFAQGYASLFTVFATVGIQRLLMRDIARDHSIAWSYVWAAEAVILALSVTVFCIVTGALLLVERNPQVIWAVAAAGVWVIVIWAIQQPLESLLIAKERMVLLSVANVAGGVLRLFLVFLVVRRVPTGAAAHGAIALANLLDLVLCFMFCVMAGGWERPRLRISLAVHHVRESIPFVTAALCSIIYFKSDISILKFMRGDEAAGLYTPAVRLMEPLMMVAGLWGTAVFPALCRFSHTAADRYEQLKKTSLRLALMAAFPMAVGIAILAEPIIRLLTGARAAEYVESVLLLRMLCVALPLFYLNGVTQEFLYSAHRNWVVVGSYAAAAFVSVCGNVVLIPLFEVRAVGVVAIATNLCVSIILVAVMAREFASMKLVMLTAKTAAACVVMGAIAHVLIPLSLVASVVGGAAVYVFLQAVLKTLNTEERTMLNRILRRTTR